jgi:hypothetical protein
LRFLLSGCRFLILGFRSFGGDDFGGDERLKLDGVGSRRRGSIDQFKSPL